MKACKILLCSVATFLAIGSCSSAFAHTINGSLANKRGAADLFTVVCSDDTSSGTTVTTDHLSTQIVARPRNAITYVSVQTLKGEIVTNSTDLVHDGVSLSQEVKNKGGSGTYHVMVDKAGIGKVRYQLEFHCESSDNDHTITEEQLIQDR